MANIYLAKIEIGAKDLTGSRDQISGLCFGFYDIRFRKRILFTFHLLYEHFNGHCKHYFDGHYISLLLI